MKGNFPYPGKMTFYQPAFIIITLLVCLLVGNVCQVINVAHGPRVKFNFTKLKCALISFVNVNDFK